MRAVLLLFAFGLSLRLLFWLATGDRFEPFAAAFQGDAAVWQELASKANHGGDDLLLRLPLRPPAMHWLVSALWDGSVDSAWRMRLVFILLGALIAPLVWLLLRRHLEPRVAWTTAGLCAAASPLLTLGSGPHTELPYLLLVLVSLFDQERLRRAPTVAVAVRWGALHALLCLLRAEHALTFLAFAALLVWPRAPVWRRSVLLALATWVLVLVPWHVIAFAKIDTYNDTGAPQLPAAGQTLPGALPWDAEALAKVAQLPAFQQGMVFRLVTDTVRTRGRTAVTAPDLEIIQEAYETWPEPLPWSFVCLYGGLNFFLGNSRESAGGFSRGALERMPPLAAQPAARYPPGLVPALEQRLRSGDLILEYPPHLDRVVHGYRAGFAEMGADPSAAAGRIAKKLWHAVEGAAPGLGGYALPIGMSGVRRPVDLVTATGTWPVIYRVALLLLAAFGLWSLRGKPWLLPWLVFGATKLVIVAAFFGYARQGALCVPIVMLGVAAALDRLSLLRARVLWVALAVLLGVELVRSMTTEIVIELPDGTPAIDVPNEHRLLRVTYA